jgi:hypothetical protein
MGLGVSPEARDGTEAIRALLRSGTLSETRHKEMRAAGFRYLVIHRQHHPFPPDGGAHLSACLGLPLVDTDALRVHDLGDTHSPAGCIATALKSPRL